MSSKPEIVPVLTARKPIEVGKKVRKAASSRLIVVLGMHRTGTSVAARSVKALGAELGDNLMKPIANNNEKGFWEDLDFYQLNERVLAKAKSGWHYLHSMDSALFQKADYAAERIEAAALLEQKIQNASVFAVKDPRTAVLLPFWRCVFDDLDIKPSYLITLRNPLEAAESLRKRDGFDRHKSLVLWLKYTYAAIKGTEEAKRIFVSYQNLMMDPHGELRRLAEGLELILPPSDSHAVKEFVADFLDASLNHNRVSDNELRRDETIPAPIPRLYDLVHEWCIADPSTSTVLPASVSKEVEAYFESRGDFLGYSDRVEETLAAVRKQVKQSEATAKELNAKLSDLKLQSESDIASLQTELSVLTGALFNAIANSARASDLSDLRRAETLGAKALIEQLQGILAGYAAELKRAEAQIDEHEKELNLLEKSSARYQEQLSASSATYEAVVADLRKELRLQRASLLELRSSTSWRLTRPVRDLKLLLYRSSRVVARMATKKKG